MSLNTYPYNPFPASTDKLDEAHNAELQQEIDTLKSGLTNYQTQNDLNLEVPDRKNVVNVTVTNSTEYGVTITKNSNGTVTITGANATSYPLPINIGTVTLHSGKEYIFSGCPSGGGDTSYRLDLRQGGTLYDNVIDGGSGYTFTARQDVTVDCCIRINSSYTLPDGGVTFSPMIRPATITDPTFAPYIPSVESRIEAVENGVDLSASVIAGEHVTIDKTASYIIKVGCIVVCMFSLTATQNLSINDEILLTNMPIPSKTRVVPISCGSKQFQCSVNTSGVFKFSYSDNTLQLGETAKMLFTYPL